jgi:hypothetical protein
MDHVRGIEVVLSGLGREKAVELRNLSSEMLDAQDSEMLHWKIDSLVSFWVIYLKIAMFSTTIQYRISLN